MLAHPNAVVRIDFYSVFVLSICVILGVIAYTALDGNKSGNSGNDGSIIIWFAANNTVKAIVLLSWIEVHFHFPLVPNIAIGG